MDREWLGRAAGWYLLVTLGWPFLMLRYLSPARSSSISTRTSGFGSRCRQRRAGRLARQERGHRGERRREGRDGSFGEPHPRHRGTGLCRHLCRDDIDCARSSVVRGCLIRTVAFKAAVTLDTWPAWPGGWWLLIGAAIAFVVGLVSSIWININRFSLHAMYRNRLIRAFLGASRVQARAKYVHRLRRGRQSTHAYPAAAARPAGRRRGQAGMAAVPRDQHRAQRRVDQAAGLAGTQGSELYSERAAFRHRMWRAGAGRRWDRARVRRMAAESRLARRWPYRARLPAPTWGIIPRPRSPF